VVALTVAGVALGGSAQWASFETQGGWKWTWRALALVGALLAAGAPAVDRTRREKREEQHEEAIRRVQEEQIIAFNDALDPLVDKLGSLVTTAPRERPVEFRALLTQALSSITGMIGPDRTRACFFKVQTDEGPTRLVPMEHTGRAGKPRTTFEEGTRNGDFVIDLLRRDEPYFCPDVVEQPPPGWDASRPRGYRTFISVPASVGEECFGLVTVDAPNPGDLFERDVALVTVIGTVIAAAIKIADTDAET